MEAVELSSGPAYRDWPLVRDWRLKQLLEAGYPVHLAERVADDSTIDLHKAVEMVERGCRPESAAEILL